MSRFDAIGLFWEDRPPEKPPKKEKPKPVIPDPVWLEPGYLPHLEEALAFKPDLFTDEELLQAQRNKEVLVWDVESYPNYWAVAFKSVQSGKCILFEKYDGVDFPLGKLKWVMESFQLVDFNGENYDIWQAALAVAGCSAYELYEATRDIIEFGTRGWLVLRRKKVRRLAINHIDLFELTPLSPGLKMMAGRLHSPLMMDLPFQPGTNLSPEQIAITRWYCFNDLYNTEQLYKAHLPNIKLREQFGPRYRLDLRSKSDAQMAEAIFRSEYHRRTGRHVGKAKVNPGHTFRYKIPEYVKFKTPNLQWVLDLIRETDFVVNDAGYVLLPEALKKLVIPIGEAQYKIGIGGLHSREKKAGHHAGKRWILRDHDVASYYPKLILSTGLEPPVLAGVFRSIYSAIVDMRLAAKKAGDQVSSDGLKIVVNGSFGKTLDPRSCLYYPELGIQTTITGQLCLLMAIEAFEQIGLPVINANTDGIVVKCPIARELDMVTTIKSWEQQTGLEMETTDYLMMFSRDVNNYIAVKPDLKTKTKGVFGEGGVKKNPVNEICAKAVVKFLLEGAPVDQTIMASNDPTDFVEIRQVNGGGVKVWEDATVEYVGKVARWYHSTEVKGGLVTAKKGHQVANTEGARPLMFMDGSMPPDLDYDWYIEETNKLLTQIGYDDLVEQWAMVA
ncbi:MAG: hypothetical protein M0P09_06755 [Acholeplasmataceae bacterium]|nr:hypothetical protein [Acholeplasmataceae bacterium]